MSDLVKRLRIKAGMIEMGEMIAWGSDSALMREAADALEMAGPAERDGTGIAMTDYKLVPFEPTPKMVGAAEEAHMPFGDIDLALRMALLAAPDVQGVDRKFSKAVWEAAQPKMQPMRTAPMHTDNFILLLVDGKYIECFWDNAASRWQTFAEWGVMGVYDPKGWLPMPAPPQETEK